MKSKKVKILRATYNEKFDEVYLTVVLKSSRIATMAFSRGDYEYTMGIKTIFPAPIKPEHKEVLLKHLAAREMKEMKITVNDLPKESPHFQEFGS